MPMLEASILFVRCGLDIIPKLKDVYCSYIADPRDVHDASVFVCASGPPAFVVASGKDAAPVMGSCCGRPLRGFILFDPIPELPYGPISHAEMMDHAAGLPVLVLSEDTSAAETITRWISYATQNILVPT